MYFYIIYLKLTRNKHYDMDNNGYIDKDELQKFMSKFIYQGLELSDEEVKNALDIVDHDKVRILIVIYVTQFTRMVSFHLMNLLFL